MLILLFLQRELLVPGLLLGGFVTIIYLFRHIVKPTGFLRIPLEVFTMVFYVAGIWFGPLFIKATEPSIQVYAILLQFGLMILMNIGILSYYDYPVDQVLKSSSLAGTMGRKFLKPLVWISGILVLFLLLLIFLSSQERNLRIGSTAIAATENDVVHADRFRLHLSPDAQRTRSLLVREQLAGNGPAVAGQSTRRSPRSG